MKTYEVEIAYSSTIKVKADSFKLDDYGTAKFYIGKWPFKRLSGKIPYLIENVIEIENE